MTSANLLARVRRHRAWPACAVVCIWVLLACACGSDAVVYRASREGAAGRGRDGGDGDNGSAGAAGEDGRRDVCRGGGDGATLAASIVELIGESVTLSCETDADCSVTPVWPRCDPDSLRCVGCPDLAAKLVDLATCLAAARERCCYAPESPLDCIYRNCVPGCDGQ